MSGWPSMSPAASEANGEAEIGDRQRRRRAVELVDLRRIEGAVAVTEHDPELVFIDVDDEEIGLAVVVHIAEDERLRVPAASPTSNAIGSRRRKMQRCCASRASTAEGLSSNDAMPDKR